jgi:hypothetical protein
MCRYNDAVKRVRRVMLNILTALSLLLCVVTMVEWALSNSRSDALSIWVFHTPFQPGTVAPAQRAEISSYFGIIEITFAESDEVEAWPRDQVHVLGDRFVWNARSAHPVVTGLGIELPGPLAVVRSGRYAERGYTVHTRHWLVALVTGALPLLRVVSGLLKAVRVRRRARGRCRSCDYDLTGNVSGVCPECGTAVSPRLE